jgi:hypothetical protein
MAAAWEKVRSAGSRLDYQIAFHDFLEQAKIVIRSNGYETSDIEVLEDGNTAVFTIRKAPPGTRAAVELAKIQANGLALRVGGGEHGKWISAERTVLISPFHAILGKDIDSTHIRHEALHAELTRQRDNGIGSPFDAEIRSASTPFEFVTQVAKYPDFLSLQERATIAQDIELLKQGVPNLGALIDEPTPAGVDPLPPASVESIIADKQKTLSEIDDEIRTVVRIKFTRVDFKIENGIVTAYLPYQARSGKPAVFRVWLPELGVHLAALPAEADLRSGLKRKLTVYLDGANRSTPSIGAR